MTTPTPLDNAAAARLIERLAAADATMNPPGAKFTALVSRQPAAHTHEAIARRRAGQ